MQAVFVTYRSPVGCSFWVKHRVREALTPRLRLVVGQPSNEKRSFPPAARLHLGKAARNGPTARFEKGKQGGRQGHVEKTPPRAACEVIRRPGYRVERGSSEPWNKWGVARRGAPFMGSFAGEGEILR